jgi:hypothetical protein
LTVRRGKLPENHMFNLSSAVATASLLLLFQGATGGSANGGERHVVLVNNTRQPIIEVYVSDDGVGNWQPDLLGTDFLPPGGSVLVEINDHNGNCRIDVKTVFDDGSDRIARGVNVCREEGDALSVR